MKDILADQATIIERGEKVDFPLGEIVHALGIQMIFFADSRQLTFHYLEFGMDDLWSLVPEVKVVEGYEFFRAMVIKKGEEPLAALATGVDVNSTGHLPIAALFTLTRPGSREVVVAEESKHRILENNLLPAGGLDLSRLLRDNPHKEFLRLADDEASFSVSVISLI